MLTHTHVGGVRHKALGLLSPLFGQLPKPRAKTALNCPCTDAIYNVMKVKLDASVFSSPAILVTAIFRAVMVVSCLHIKENTYSNEISGGGWYIVSERFPWFFGCIRISRLHYFQQISIIVDHFIEYSLHSEKEIVRYKSIVPSLSSIRRFENDILK